MVPQPRSDIKVSARHADAAVITSDGRISIRLSKVEDYAAVILEA
jgi:hypothetical protein